MNNDYKKRYMAIGLTIFFIIAASIIFFWTVNHWTIVQKNISIILKTLSPFILGLILAYILTPLVNFFERKFLLQLANKITKGNSQKTESLSRATSIILSLGLFIFIVINLFSIVITQLYGNISSIERLIISIPIFINTVSDWINTLLQDNPSLKGFVMPLLENTSNFIVNWVQTSFIPEIYSFLAGISNGVMSFINGVLNIFVALVVSIYVMFSKETLAAQIKKLLYSFFRPDQVSQILNATKYVHKAFGGFFSGKILDSFIIGIICLLGMTLLNLPSAGLISIIIGISNIIPFFGPFIGAIPSALLILLESPIQCLIFLIFILALQQFDGNILGPKILGNSTGLTGLWVLFAIIVGGGLFGFAGMLCGVPVFAVIYGGIKYYCNNRLIERNMPTDTTAYIIKPTDLSKVKKDKPTK